MIILKLSSGIDVQLFKYFSQGHNDVRWHPGQEAQVWRPHVRTWGLSEVYVLYWRKYLWHCWDFSAPSAVFRHPGNCAPILYAPGCAYNVEVDFTRLSLAERKWNENLSSLLLFQAYVDCTVYMDIHNIATRSLLTMKQNFVMSLCFNALCDIYK